MLRSTQYLYDNFSKTKYTGQRNSGYVSSGFVISRAVESYDWAITNKEPNRTIHTKNGNSTDTKQIQSNCLVSALTAEPLSPSKCTVNLSDAKNNKKCIGKIRLKTVSNENPIMSSYDQKDSKKVDCGVESVVEEPYIKFGNLRLKYFQTNLYGGGKRKAADSDSDYSPDKERKRKKKYSNKKANKRRTNV